MVFPIYRKYVGLNVWFKVLDDRNFIEVKQVGTKFIKHELHAQQYPEIVRIQDMINCLGDAWEPIAASVFEEKFEKC